MARIIRLRGRLKRLQPSDAGTRNPSAVAGPGAAPSWAAHPAIPALPTARIRAHVFTWPPAQGCLTRPQLPRTDALREGGLRILFLQAACSSRPRKRKESLSPDDDCGGVSASPQSRHRMKAEERIYPSPTRHMLRKTKVAEITQLPANGGRQEQRAAAQGQRVVGANPRVNTSHRGTWD